MLISDWVLKATQAWMRSEVGLPKLSFCLFHFFCGAWMSVIILPSIVPGGRLAFNKYLPSVWVVFSYHNWIFSIEYRTNLPDEWHQINFLRVTEDCFYLLTDIDTVCLSISTPGPKIPVSIAMVLLICNVLESSISEAVMEKVLNGNIWAFLGFLSQSLIFM